MDCRHGIFLPKYTFNSNITSPFEIQKKLSSVSSHIPGVHYVSPIESGITGGRSFYSFLVTRGSEFLLLLNEHSLWVPTILLVLRAMPPAALHPHSAHWNLICSWGEVTSICPLWWPSGGLAGGAPPSQRFPGHHMTLCSIWYRPPLLTSKILPALACGDLC